MSIKFLEKDLDFLFEIDGKYYFMLYGKAYEVKQNEDGTWETTGGTK